MQHKKNPLPMSEIPAVNLRTNVTVKPLKLLIMKCIKTGINLNDLSFLDTSIKIT